ncbi:MAG: hypothetical protein NT031_15525 [Planctomycetota bacterium]|nr:hypothetical protein [Planctomycetota bacterium]
MVVFVDGDGLAGVLISCLLAISLQQLRIVLLKKMVRRRDETLRELLLNREAKTNAALDHPRAPEAGDDLPP